MRINCPFCGERDRREFYYKGSDDYLSRPEEGDQEGLHAYLHLRDNPTGVTRDLWQHEAGCAAWLVVARNVTTHEILSVELATKAAP
jgi:sarcosine oxidase subunit delta